MSTFQEPSTSMPYVKVKTKGQVTIPAEFRRDFNLKEGDLLEVVVERGGIPGLTHEMAEGSEPEESPVSCLSS